MKSYLVLILLAAAALAGCASSGTSIGRAAPSAPAEEKFALKSYTLANGMRLIVKELPEGPVSIQAWVAGGSSTDTPGRPGLAHMVEHMLLTGSQRLPPGRFEYYIESMGGSVTANTSRDFTYYGVTVPPGPGWERAGDMLYDIVSSPRFEQAALDSQKKIVKLELNRRKAEPDTLLLDNFFGQAYQAHPYRRTVTGAAADVDVITLQEVKDYHARMYIPALMNVAVAGPVKAGAVRAAFEKTFGTMKPVKPLSLRFPDEPYQVHRREKSEDMPVGSIYFALGWRVCGATEQDIYALEVLSALLGQGKGSRLHQELRERKGVAFNVRCELMALRDQGVMVVLANLMEKGMLSAATDEILRQVNRMKDEDVSAQEIERAINRIASTHLLEGETADGQAYNLGYGAIVFGIADPAAYEESIRKVTPADVRRAAQRYLGEGNYTVSVVRPE